jgi:hypothetical protein
MPGKVPLTWTYIGGGDRNRTGVQGFAGPCLSHSATPPEGDNHSGHPSMARTPPFASRAAGHGDSLLALATEHLAAGSAEVDAHAYELATVMFGSTEGPTRSSR